MFRSMNWRTAVLCLAVAICIILLISYYNPNAWGNKISQTITVVLALFLSALVVFVYTLFRFSWRDLSAAEAVTESEIASSNAALAEGDTSIKPAWDRAMATLDRYWQRNAYQNSLIFAVSVVVSLLGFVVMLVGVISALATGANLWAASLVTLAGMLTQFIGATFLLLYRSTVQQMMMFNATLERINTVGMAWFIAQAIDDSLPEGKSIKNDACKALALSVVARSGDTNNAAKI